MKKNITLVTLCFYAITLIVAHLMFLFFFNPVVADIGIADELFVFIVLPAFFIFPALATYGYSLFLYKTEQKHKTLKYILWLLAITVNILIVLYPEYLKYYLFSRHEGQSIIDYLLEIVLTFFVYMLPMVIALICFVMNSNIKQKLSEKNNDTILKSVSAVLYSATGILIVAISVGCVLYTIFCVGFVFHF